MRRGPTLLEQTPLRRESLKPVDLRRAMLLDVSQSLVVILIGTDRPANLTQQLWAVRVPWPKGYPGR